MIEILPESGGNVVGARATGTLTDQDYKDVLIPYLEKLMTDNRKVRFLLDIGQDFQGWTLQALWDDATFGWEHRKNFEKVALVGGALWMDLGAKAGALLMSGELRTFPHEQREEAWNWIQSHPHVEEATQASTLSTDMAENSERKHVSVESERGNEISTDRSVRESQ